MDIKQAIKLFGLEDNPTGNAIEQAYDNKKTNVESKLAAAPTEALKAKFQTMLTTLTEAKSVLLTSVASSAHSTKKSSPLTESKLFDIPGIAPEDINKLEMQQGTVLAGRYTIEEQIGAGGMGAVYSAIDANTQEPVAIKLMLPSLVKNQRAQERFMDEARISQKLSHPNIVNVHDVQQDGDLYFLTMELLEGQDLRSYLDNLKNTHQSCEVEYTLEIVNKICQALAYAHELTIHRDIKPENIWLCSDGKIKVMDFGLARLQSASQRSSSGAVLGTAYYMAPEQIKGREDIDGRADQFAIGVLLYEMLSGDIPTGRLEDLRTLNKTVSKKLSATVNQLLSTKPEQRFIDMAAVITAINNNAGFVMPTLPFKTIGIAGGVLLAVLLIGGLVSGGGLTNGLHSVWEALKPIDKELIAQQKAQAAKLQGEIKNYKQRLDNGRRNLNSDLRDASRNNSSGEKYLAHWQTLTDDYLFEGNQLTELEGELTMGESLLRDGSTEQAKTTLTQVRDGYKELLAQFDAAENLLNAEEDSDSAFKQWEKRKKAYNFDNPSQATEAMSIEEGAKQSQREGDFVGALEDWQVATEQWKAAYRAVSGDVASIDKQRAEDKAVREKVARKKAADKATREKVARKKAAIKAEKAKAARERIAKVQVIKQAVGMMVSIPSGSFQMGCVSGQGCESNENPLHRVNIQAFSMIQTEVTFAQWDACVNAGGCSYKPSDKGWGRDNRPVINVSFNDITNEFLPWLNKVTGMSGNKKYRLPTEAEWEYAARAGTTTPFSTGRCMTASHAHYYGDHGGNNCGGNTGYKEGNKEKTVSVKSFSPNAFGLYDMHGNVLEWTQDCWSDSYAGAYINGKARTNGDCGMRVLRGGAYDFSSSGLRSASRFFSSRSERSKIIGFRLVQGK